MNQAAKIQTDDAARRAALEAQRQQAIDKMKADRDNQARAARDRQGELSKNLDAAKNANRNGQGPSTFGAANQQTNRANSELEKVKSGMPADQRARFEDALKNRGDKPLTRDEAKNLIKQTQSGPGQQDQQTIQSSKTGLTPSGDQTQLSIKPSAQSSKNADALEKAKSGMPADQRARFEEALKNRGDKPLSRDEARNLIKESAKPGATDKTGIKLGEQTQIQKPGDTQQATKTNEQLERVKAGMPADQRTRFEEALKNRGDKPLSRDDVKNLIKESGKPGVTGKPGEVTKPGEVAKPVDAQTAKTNQQLEQVKAGMPADQRARFEEALKTRGDKPLSRDDVKNLIKESGKPGITGKPGEVTKPGEVAKPVDAQTAKTNEQLEKVKAGMPADQRARFEEALKTRGDKPLSRDDVKKPHQGVWQARRNRQTRRSDQTRRNRQAR